MRGAAAPPLAHTLAALSHSPSATKHLWLAGAACAPGFCISSHRSLRPWLSPRQLSMVIINGSTAHLEQLLGSCPTQPGRTSELERRPCRPPELTAGRAALQVLRSPQPFSRRASCPLERDWTSFSRRSLALARQPPSARASCRTWTTSMLTARQALRSDSGPWSLNQRCG